MVDEKIIGFATPNNSFERETYFVDAINDKTNLDCMIKVHFDF